MNKKDNYAMCVNCLLIMGGVAFCVWYGDKNNLSNMGDVIVRLEKDAFENLGLILFIVLQPLIIGGASWVTKNGNKKITLFEKK